MNNLFLSLTLASAIFNSVSMNSTQEIKTDNPNTRIENGYLISFVYNEFGDYMTSTIVTDDGNVWEIDDFVCNRGARLQVTFDTMGTNDITDDQVTKIVATVEA